MQRRKFLASVGSLAAGSAAAIGTGAFTTGEVKRGATIRVSNDDTDAKLGFSTKVNYGGYSGGDGRSEYAKVTGGVLEIDFSGSDAPGKSESGMNPNGSIYHFNKVFRIINQGEKTVLVGMDIGNLRSQAALKKVDVSTNRGGGADLDTTLDFSSDPPTINNKQTGAILDPGESLLVNFRFETADKTGYDTPFESTPMVSIGAVDTKKADSAT
jgi:hypothetical protein